MWEGRSESCVKCWGGYLGIDTPLSLHIDNSISQLSHTGVAISLRMIITFGVLSLEVWHATRPEFLVGQPPNLQRCVH